MSAEPADHTPPRFAGMEDLPLEIAVRLGASRCTLRRLTGLQPGEVLRLDRGVGEPFELRCGDVLLARVVPVAHETGIAVKILEVPEESE